MRGLRADIRQQQGLGIGVEALYLLDDELRPGLDDLFHRAPIDGTQDALAVLVGNIRRQLDLDLEDLLVAVFRVDDVVLRQANVLGGSAPSEAVELYTIRRTQRRGSQEVVKRSRSRAVALVADRLIGHHREVIELGFKSEVVEEVDLDFHGRYQNTNQKNWPALSRFARRKGCVFRISRLNAPRARRLASVGATAPARSS